MTARLPFTKASLKRAIDAAREAGLAVVGIRPDGMLVVSSVDNPSPPVQPDSAKEHNSEVVDKWADAQ